MTLWKRSTVAGLAYFAFVVAAGAVALTVTDISEGMPLPGTTISLETLSGETIPLRPVDAAEAPTDGSVSDQPAVEAETTLTASPGEVGEQGEDTVEPLDTGEPQETVSVPVPEGQSTDEAEPTQTASAEDGAERGEDVVQTRDTVSIPVLEDGSAEFEVADEYEDRLVIIVIRDASGNVIDRRQARLSGVSLALSLSGLPKTAGVPDDGAGRAADSSARPDLADPAVEQAFDSTTDGRTEMEVGDVYATPNIEFEAGIGAMSRGSFSPLRLQDGGFNLVAANFAAVEREGTFSHVGFSFKNPTGHRDPFWSGTVNFIGGVQVGLSEASASGTNISARGYGLGILGPEGPGGFFNGGVAINSAFADVNSLHYADKYQEIMVRAGAATQLKTSGLHIEPSFQVFVGQTSEDLSYSGRSANSSVGFAYDVSTSTRRLGVQIGTEIATTPRDNFTLFGSGDIRLVQNWGHAKAALDMTGVVVGSEFAKAYGNLFDIGAVVRGGVRYEREQVAFEVGGQFETWQVPVARITGEVPLYVDYRNRNSWSVYGRLKIRIGN
ncbi:hypothetical protein SAMN05877838_2111 [Hoeflea halophila]|uniref:Uncharacterized protein n=1 Tax=Hoeflea halophila TaxID=714899 RepID=A0A286IAS3_9HYPH|nr:hypothetical protein [Hoeflea halophila]SOE17218.1 hypothetical protein SAMN05877838_2111 [Hoeflea halophila]